MDIPTLSFQFLNIYNTQLPKIKVNSQKYKVDFTHTNTWTLHI